MAESFEEKLMSPLAVFHRSYKYKNSPIRPSSLCELCLHCVKVKQEYITW